MSVGRWRFRRDRTAGRHVTGILNPGGAPFGAGCGGFRLPRPGATRTPLTASPHPRLKLISAGPAPRTCPASPGVARSHAAIRGEATSRNTAGNARESGLADDTGAVSARELTLDVPSREPSRPRDRQWDVTLAVIIGGILGAEARYGISVAVPHTPAGFPWSTVCINVIGSFCLGVLMTLLSQLTAPHRLMRPFAGIGIIGGFTTFSTFAVDAERLIEHHRPGLALLYVICTVVTAAAAVAAATVTSQVAVQQVRATRIRRADRARSDARPRRRRHGKGRR